MSTFSIARFDAGQSRPTQSPLTLSSPVTGDSMNAGVVMNVSPTIASANKPLKQFRILDRSQIRMSAMEEEIRLGFRIKIGRNRISDINSFYGHS